MEADGCSRGSAYEILPFYRLDSSPFLIILKISFFCCSGIPSPVSMIFTTTWLLFSLEMYASSSILPLNVNLFAGSRCTVVTPAERDMNLYGYIYIERELETAHSSSGMKKEPPDKSVNRGWRA